MLEEKIIKDILNKFNLSSTKTRIQLIKYLSDSHHFHSIQEIIEHNKSFNIKSIYNNLEILLRLGIVNVYLFNGIAKYTIEDKFLNLENKVHVIHKQGEKIEHLELPKKIYNDIKKHIKSKCKINKIKIDIYLN